MIMFCVYRLRALSSPIYLRLYDSILHSTHTYGALQIHSFTDGFGWRFYFCLFSRVEKAKSVVQTGASIYGWGRHYSLRWCTLNTLTRRTYTHRTICWDGWILPYYGMLCVCHTLWPQWKCDDVEYSTVCLCIHRHFNVHVWLHIYFYIAGGTAYGTHNILHNDSSNSILQQQLTVQCSIDVCKIVESVEVWMIVIGYRKRL